MFVRSLASANGRSWRILPAAPTAAFSPFPPVHRAHLERVLWGRFAPFAAPSTNGRYLRKEDGGNRRKAAVWIATSAIAQLEESLAKAGAIGPFDSFSRVP